jgi:hypothetical protein
MASEKQFDGLEKPDTAATNTATIELGISEPANALQRFCNRLDAICDVVTTSTCSPCKSNHIVVWICY